LALALGFDGHLLLLLTFVFGKHGGFLSLALALGFDGHLLLLLAFLFSKHGGFLGYTLSFHGQLPLLFLFSAHGGFLSLVLTFGLCGQLTLPFLFLFLLLFSLHGGFLSLALALGIQGQLLLLLLLFLFSPHDPLAVVFGCGCGFCYAIGADGELSGRMGWVSRGMEWALRREGDWTGPQGRGLRRCLAFGLNHSGGIRFRPNGSGAVACWN
jgi:hypothetical protein